MSDQVKDRFHQLIQDCILKISHLIVQSRVESVASDDTNKWFNLETPSSSEITQKVSIYKDDLSRPMQILIFLNSPPGQPLVRTCIEQWCLKTSPPDRNSGDLSGRHLKSTYLKSIVLMRSLYTFLRILPAHRLVRHCQKNKTIASQFSFEVIPDDGINGIVGARSGFDFAGVNTPLGNFNLSVVYRQHCPFSLLQSASVNPLENRIAEWPANSGRSQLNTVSCPTVRHDAKPLPGGRGNQTAKPVSVMGGSVGRTSTDEIEEEMFGRRSQEKPMGRIARMSSPARSPPISMYPTTDPIGIPSSVDNDLMLPMATPPAVIGGLAQMARSPVFVFSTYSPSPIVSPSESSTPQKSSAPTSYSIMDSPDVAGRHRSERDGASPGMASGPRSLSSKQSYKFVNSPFKSGVSAPEFSGTSPSFSNPFGPPVAGLALDRLFPYSSEENSTSSETRTFFEETDSVGFAFASDVGDMSAHIADFVSYCKAAPPLSFMRDGQREKLEERDDASKDNTSSASGALRGSSSISSVGQGQGRHQNGRTLRMCLEDLNRFQKLCTLPSSSRPST